MNDSFAADYTLRSVAGEDDDCGCSICERALRAAAQAGPAPHASTIRKREADDCGCSICERVLRATAEEDPAPHASTIREREADFRDLLSDNSPRSRTAQRQRTIKRVKEEIPQRISTFLASRNPDVRSFTLCSPSYLPNYDDPFNGYATSDSDEDGDDSTRGDCEDHDSGGDLWSLESSGCMGFDGERMSALRDAWYDEGFKEWRGEQENTATLEIAIPPSTNQFAPRSALSWLIPQSYHAETPIEEVRRKMRRAALPGESEALTHVKHLVTLAHRTPAHLRTDAQRCLLAEWKRPPATPSFVDAKSVNVYVDASGNGIGFYFQEQWQAWRLNSCWRKKKGSCTQWAEAVAIELGLRLLIEAGYSSRRIVVYSDNVGAIDAIRLGNTLMAHVGEVVQCILLLCEKYRLDLSVKWIPGRENPADAPSRFRIEDEKQRFPYDIDIPIHLQAFIAPY